MPLFFWNCVKLKTLSFPSPFLVHGEQKWCDRTSAVNSSFFFPFFCFRSPYTAKILNKRRMKGLVYWPQTGVIFIGPGLKFFRWRSICIFWCKRAKSYTEGKELNLKTWILPRFSFGSVPFEKKRNRSFSVPFLYRSSECLVYIYIYIYI